MDWSIDAIKDEHIANLRKREVFMIERSEYGYRVHHWTADGVGPQSDYDTPHEAAARVLQLLNIKEPVKPQDWPERVCIGRIETDDQK